MNADSNREWVARTPLRFAENVADLRRIRGLDVLVDGDVLWLRGDDGAGDLSDRIRSIPDAELFERQPGEQLTRSGETVPCARMPQGDWQPIARWVELQLPRSGFSATVRDKVNLKLVRSTTPIAANLLETTWKAWFEYVISAPQIRLCRLVYALSDQDRVLVRGQPLPPIPGRTYFESDGVIFPTGWRFDPEVGPIVVRKILRLGDCELALFAENGSYARIPESAFVQATRSSVRACCRG